VWANVRARRSLITFLHSPTLLNPIQPATPSGRQPSTLLLWTEWSNDQGL
jgi:hypothetical protein